MKYTYGNIDEKEIIKNYSIKGEDLVVKYLDGTKQTLTEADKDNVNDKMKEQLEAAIKSHVIGKSITYKVLLETLATIIIISTGAFYIVNKDEFKSLVTQVVTCLSGISLATLILLITYEIDKINHFKTLETFSKIENDYNDTLDDENIYAGTKIKNDINLDINSVQNVSYKDIKQVETNISRCRMFPNKRS